MGKFWSLLFLTVPIFGVAVFLAAPYNKYDLPADISEHGREVDHLWYFILILTGVVFVITEVVLFWFLWRYDGASNRTPVKYTHGSHNLEVVWTIVPAATLLFIAIYQMNAWAEVKIRKPDMPPTLEVTARQFEWRLRYPGIDGKIGTQDDLHHVNDMHIPVDTDVLIDLKSMDVLHSLFLPHLRIKQDAVPGHKIPVWFRAKEVGSYDIVCAELCGWGHYKMKGRVTVESKRDYAEWLRRMTQEQEAVADAVPSPGESAE